MTLKTDDFLLYDTVTDTTIKVVVCLSYRHPFLYIHTLYSSVKLLSTSMSVRRCLYVCLLCQSLYEILFDFVEREHSSPHLSSHLTSSAGQCEISMFI